jgi:chromosome partitioning protein
LAASLASLEQECLLIDIDPQSNATSGLGINKNMLKKDMYDVLIDELSLEDILQDTVMDWLDIAPASTDLSGAEVGLVSMINREERLKIVLEKFQKVYKYIIVDCPPSLGLLTINALIAANSVIIPMQCEFFALEGLGQLSKTIFALMQTYNLELEGVLFTMFDTRTNLSQQVVDEVKKFFKENVYETKIPRTIKLAEAPSFGKPALLYDPTGKGAQSYMDFTKEFLERQENAEK